MSWAADNRQYVSMCDGVGFSGQLSLSYNTRMISVSDGARDPRFHDLPGYPNLAAPSQTASDTRYYGFGTLALDGFLYQFMSTFNRPFHVDNLRSKASSDVMRFNGVKLIYSPDQGRTWHNQDGSTPIVWDSWDRRSRDTMVFFEEDQEAFSLLSVLQMGRNYGFNRDGYVYVYAPNGNTEGSMNELVMFRVPKARLLDRHFYEYFAGRQDGGAARWTRDIESRAVVHTFPRGWVNKLVHPYAWQPSVVYNDPLGLYMMANWATGCTPEGVWFSKPSYLGFWVASDPWGPWMQIHEDTSWRPAGDVNARAYQPQIAPKWIAADGRSFWLVWTDFQGATNEELKRFWAEYERKASANQISEGDVIENAKMMRKFMPYYGFNVQRIDLEIA
ncbi:DUF4185 domain-containing protein [Peristeroidobacter soli]|uniref:DUF4185 domain-containing protein n=1 Tax=Peristeroidobacter soli TaxID=2497877 RepID=UPI00101DE315|nr:DUF4185 domain-containing protein [Peristeroidobacter soli]